MNTAIVNYSSTQTIVEIDALIGKGQYVLNGNINSQVFPISDYMQVGTTRMRIQLTNKANGYIVTIAPLGHSFQSEDAIELITSTNKVVNSEYTATIKEIDNSYSISITHNNKTAEFTWTKLQSTLRTINIGDSAYDVILSFTGNNVSVLDTLSISIKPTTLYKYTPVDIVERVKEENPFANLTADIVYDTSTQMYELKIDDKKLDWKYETDYYSTEIILNNELVTLTVSKAYAYILREKPSIIVNIKKDKTYPIKSTVNIIQSNNNKKVDEVFQYLQLQLEFKYDVTNVECRVKNYGIVACSIVIPQSNASHTATVKISGKEYSLYIYSADRKASAVNKTKDYSAWLYAIEGGQVKTDKSMKVSNTVYAGWPGQANTSVSNTSTRTTYTPPVTPPPPKTWSYIGKCLNADFYTTTDKKEWEVRVDNKAVINTKFKQNCVERFVVSEHNTKALSINQVCKILKLKNDFIFDIAVIEKNEAKRTAITTLANDKTTPHDEYFAKLAYAALEGLSPSQRRIVIQQLNQAEMVQRKKTAS